MIRHYTTKEIRKFISCPQFGDLEYGKWGALRLEQRVAYKELIEEIERLSKEVDMWNKKYNEQFGIINELEKWLKILNDNGVVIDLDGEETTIMPTISVINKIKSLKGDISNE